MSEKMGLQNVSECFPELCDWNDANVAFIKPDICDGRKMWLIYDAEGEKIAATDNRDFAFIVARQNDLEPCSVH